MRKFISIILIALILIQFTSASVIEEYSIDLNDEFTWKLDYIRSEGRDSKYEEYIINGTITANITQISDQGVYADLNINQYTDEDISNQYGLVKLLEANTTDKAISVAGNITDIIYIQYEDIIPFIWPTNTAFWNMIIENFNRSYSSNYEGQYKSSGIFLKDGKYMIKQFSDETPVDGGRNNASMTIDASSGLMEEMMITTKVFFTLNPPVITQLKVTLVDSDFSDPDKTESNPINILGLDYYLIFIGILGIIIKTKKLRS